MVTATDHLIWIVPFIAFADAVITLFVHIQSLRSKKDIDHGIKKLHRSFYDTVSVSSNGDNRPSRARSISCEESYKHEIEEIEEVQQVNDVGQDEKVEDVTIFRRNGYMSIDEINA